MGRTGVGVRDFIFGDCEGAHQWAGAREITAPGPGHGPAGDTRVSPWRHSPVGCVWARVYGRTGLARPTMEHGRFKILTKKVNSVSREAEQGGAYFLEMMLGGSDTTPTRRVVSIIRRRGRRHRRLSRDHVSKLHRRSRENVKKYSYRYDTNTRSKARRVV